MKVAEGRWIVGIEDTASAIVDFANPEQHESPNLPSCVMGWC